jgi:hypothetical protein
VMTAGTVLDYSRLFQMKEVIASRQDKALGPGVLASTAWT